jgi:hypothetical protein
MQMTASSSLSTPPAVVRGKSPRFVHVTFISTLGGLLYGDTSFISGALLFVTLSTAEGGLALTPSRRVRVPRSQSPILQCFLSNEPFETEFTGTRYETGTRLRYMELIGKWRCSVVARRRSWKLGWFGALGFEDVSWRENRTYIHAAFGGGVLSPLCVVDCA